MADIGDIRGRLIADTKQFEQALTKSQKRAQTFGTSMAKVGALIGGAFTFSIAIRGIGRLTTSFQDATRIIARETGAIGSDLRALDASFKRVLGNVSEGATTVATTMAALANNVGATGDVLEDLTEQLLDTARIFGTDATQAIDGFTKVMVQWQIPAEDGTARLEELFAISQRYGVSINRLNVLVAEYGAVLANAGFTLQETAELQARLTRAGLNWTRISPGINAAFRRWAEEGLDLRAALFDTIEQIERAADETEALAIATDAFGAEGAARLTRAIRDGVFTLKELQTSLARSEGIIRRTEKATRTWADAWGEAGNAITVRASPALDFLNDALTTLADTLTVAITSTQSLDEANKRLVSSADEAGKAVQRQAGNISAGSASIKAALTLLQVAWRLLTQDAEVVFQFLEVKIKELALVFRQTLQAIASTIPVIGEKLAQGMEAGIDAAKAELVELQAALAAAARELFADTELFRDATMEATGAVDEMAVAISEAVAESAELHRQWALGVRLVKQKELQKAWAEAEEIIDGIINEFPAFLERQAEATKEANKMLEAWRAIVQWNLPGKVGPQLDAMVQDWRRAQGILTDASVEQSNERFNRLQKERGDLFVAWTQTGKDIARVMMTSRQQQLADVHAVAKQQIEENRAAAQKGIITEEQRRQRVREIRMGELQETKRILGQLNTFQQEAMLILQQSASVAFGNIRSQVSQLVVDWKNGVADVKAFWDGILDAMLATAVQMLLQLAGQWVISQLAFETGEGTKTASLLAAETARTAIVAEQETARNALLAAGAQAFGALLVAQISAISQLATGMVIIMANAAASAVDFMLAIAKALIAGVITAPLAGPVLAAAQALSFAILPLATKGIAAIEAAALTAAGTISATTTIGGAAGTAGGGQAGGTAAGGGLLSNPALLAGAVLLPLAVLGGGFAFFQHGGVVERPTFGLFGEAGPEAVIPLDRFGGLMDQTIIIELDGRVLSKVVLDDLPRQVRLKGVPIV